MYWQMNMTQYAGSIGITWRVAWLSEWIALNAKQLDQQRQIESLIVTV